MTNPRLDTVASKQMDMVRDATTSSDVITRFNELLHELKFNRIMKHDYVTGRGVKNWILTDEKGDPFRITESKDALFTNRGANLVDEDGEPFWDN